MRNASKPPEESSPTQYPDLNGVLHELSTGIQGILGEDFVALCLQGSCAVGGFDQHSDVDFIVAADREPSDEQVAALQAMHERIYRLDCTWAQRLEGSYFPKETLRDYSRRDTRLWYLDNGSRSLIRSGHCNTVVVRWTVREHGVRVAGTDPAALVDPIPVAALRRDIAETLRNWGGQILADPEPYRNRFYQGFIVLSYCRMLHDLYFGCTGSKRMAAEWARSVLNPSWSGLIDRAWDCRPNPALSVRTPPDPDDFQRTLDFVRHIIELSSRYKAPE